MTVGGPGVTSEPPRVVLAGWYGAANLGDELLLQIVAQWVREGGAVPIAISTHPDFTRATMGIDAVGYGDLPAIVEVLADADLFVLGGGGLFQDYNEFDLASLARFPCWNVSQYAQFLFLADELGLPTLALAQGVGPLRGEEGRAIAADVFTRAAAVSVRDTDSARLLREIGVSREVTLAADPAWSWRPAPSRIPIRSRYPQLQGRKVMAMILRDWPFDPDWEHQCVLALRASIPEGWALLWLDFHRPPDAATTGFSEIARRVSAQLGDRPADVIWDGVTVDEAAALLAQCDACVAMRLHGVLLAAASGLPVVSIEYDGKVAALGRDLGLPSWQRVGMRELGERLPEAVAHVTRKAEGSVLAPAAIAKLGIDALAHRDVLLRQIACLPSPSVGRAVAARDRWLPAWLEATPAATPRVVAALTRRLRRLGGGDS